MGACCRGGRAKRAEEGVCAQRREGAGVGGRRCKGRPARDCDLPPLGLASRLHSSAFSYGTQKMIFFDRCKALALSRHFAILAKHAHFADAHIYYAHTLLLPLPNWICVCVLSFQRGPGNTRTTHTRMRPACVSGVQRSDGEAQADLLADGVEQVGVVEELRDADVLAHALTAPRLHHKLPCEVRDGCWLQRL